MIDRASKANLTATETVTTNRTEKPQNEGLQQIQGKTTERSGTTVRSGGTKIDDANGTAGLPAITKKLAETLGKITGKGDEIRSKLPDGVRQNFEGHVGQCSKQERKDLEKLLHFSHNKLGNTTKESRLEIRTALAHVVASGGTIEGATALKARLMTTPEKQLTGFMNDLKTKPDQPQFAMAKNLLVKGGHSDMVALEPALIGFKPDPSRAGRHELAHLNVTLKRDEQGNLFIANVKGNFAKPLDVPPGNQKLSQDQLDTIKATFLKAAETPYGRAAIPLAFMSEHQRINFERQTLGLPPLSMAETLKQAQIDGIKNVPKYGQSDCMGVAQQLQAQLKSMGYETIMAGMDSEALTMQRPPGSTAPQDLANSAEITGMVTHLDLLLPYTDANGDQKLMVLVTGVGHKADDNFYSDLEPNDSEFNIRRHGWGEELDASEVQKTQLKFMSNIQVRNDGWDADAKDRNMFGIDLLAGTMYLNGNATADYRANHSPETGSPTARSIVFDFKSVLDDPLGKTTVKQWDAKTNAYVDKETTKINSMFVFMKAVSAQFKQPPEFMGEMAGLVGNYHQYCEQVLAPEVQALLPKT